MKKTLLASLLPLALMASAHADNAAKPAANPVRFVAGIGLTAGGDKLATTNYTDNTSANINAGSGVQMLGGVDYRVSQDFSLQGNVGYHIHFTPEASNGDANFHRVPFELLAYYHANEQWRIGGGVRFVTGAKLSGKGAASNLNTSFKDTTGLVLEAEYFSSPNLGFKIRGVKEEYETETGNRKFSGNHIGLFANYYF